MSLKYLNSTGLSNLVTNIKNWVTARIPTKTSEITNDSGFITSSSLPTVNNATLTIQKNGTNVQTFTANASSNKTANITVPTKISELTNDSGFLTSHQSLSNYVTLNSNQTLTSTKTFTTNINTTSTATSQRETWRLIFNKDSADTDSTAAAQLGVIQSANSHNFFATLRLANPRGNNKPTTGNTSNCWSGIGIFYNYDENKGRPYANNCWDWPTSSNSSSELASTSWVRTYCETTKGFLTNSALSTNFVTTDTAQTVAGEKTFTDNTWISSNTNKYFRIKNTSWDLGQATSSSDKEFGGICFRDKDDQNLSYIIAYSWSSGYEGLRIIYRTKFSNGEKSTSGSNVDSNFTIGITPDGKRYCGTNGFWHTNLIPTVNNSITLGDTTYRWKAVYSNSYYLGTTAFGDIVTHNASEFLTSHQSLSNYSTLANTVKSISISGKTITVTPGSGSTYTLTTQDTVYTHPTSAGNKHIPSGGAANQYLKYSASGTAVWANLPTIPTKTSELTNDSGFLTSHQSLSGYLPLTGGILTGGVSRKHTGVTKGTNPESVCYWSVYNCDKDGTNYKNDCLGLFETSLDTAGVVSTYIRAMKNTANNNSNASLGVAYDTANNLGYTFAPTPAANDNTTKIATTAWVQTFCGTTKGYLTSHQSLSNYVTLNGAQTITAEKTFKSDIVFNGTYNLRSSADNSYVRIQGGSGEGKGSRIILSGKTRTNLQGYAEIVATDGTNTNTFTVKPNGETLINGNNLAATIIKGLSISGKTITYTQINGSTGTITTQDTVYTHPTSAGNKHIPSGGSSGQILKYSSSGTAVWANLEFNSLGTITKADLTQNTTTWSHTVKTRVLCFLSCDCTTNTSGSCKFKVTGSNIFRLSLNTLVGNNNYKQDTVTYGGFLDQGSTGRARFVALFYPYSSSISFTIIASGVGTPNNSEQVTSFSMTLYQLT